MDDVPTDLPSPTRLIGRDAELASIGRVVIEGAGHGRSVAGAVLIAGDAGVGKTRLVQEVVGRARDAGRLVLVGHCVHFGGDSVPYLPLSEIFGRLARDHPDLVDEVRAGFPPITRLLPQRRVIGAAPVEGGAERLASADLFDAVLGALGALAERQRLVLVVEDVHWADQSTLDLIGFLLARLPGEQAALVVSYRTDDLHRRHPLRTVATEWGRLPRVARLNLAPLQPDSIRELVRSQHPQPLSDQAVARIVDLAGGNAFFAEELLDAVGCGDQVPADLADLLLVRLERLSGDARHLVRVAAVAGRQVTHQMLALVVDLPDSALDAALREAVEAHILDRRGDAAYAFRHALLAEAVYDDLLPGERIRLHAGYASVLAKQDIRGTDADLARHARQALELPTAFQASIRAGDEAMRVAAPSEAMRHYELALELSAQVTDTVLASADLVLAAAEAAAAAGHPFRALDLVRDAVDRLPPGAPAETRALLLVAVTTYAGTLDTEVSALAASTEAVRLVPADPPSVLRARVMAVHARAAADQQRDDDATRWATDALGMARTLNLPDVAADASTTLARLDERSGDPRTAIRLLEESAVQARESGDLGAQMRTWYSLGSLHYGHGRTAEAITAYDKAMERARAGRRPWATFGIDARLMSSQAHYVGGDWDRALELAGVAGEAPPALAEAALASVGFAPRAGRGDISALDLLPRLRPWWPRDGMLAILAGGPAIDLYASAGALEEALRIHDDVVTTVSELWQQCWFQARIRLHALALGALAGASAHRSEAERRPYVERGAQLVQDAHTTAEYGLARSGEPGPEGRAWLLRADAEWARLRWLSGHDVPAESELIDAWRAAVDAFGYGHVFELARSRARLASVLHATGDVAGAREHADAARETAQRLRAEPLLAELRSLGVWRPTAIEPAGFGPLTPREREVLGLLAEGRTNRQIGRQLYISDKTASVHVSNILAKLGAAGRTEAAAIARRDGLLGEA